MSYLPRKVRFELNYMEFGALQAMISEEKFKGMKRDFPALYWQFTMWFASAYAFSDGHPLQKRAVKDYLMAKNEWKKIKRKERNAKKL